MLFILKYIYALYNKWTRKNEWRAVWGFRPGKKDSNKTSVGYLSIMKFPMVLFEHNTQTKSIFPVLK